MMKKLLLLSAFFAFFVAALTAQNAIPNAGFENWVSPQGSYEDPVDWGTINQQTSILGIETVKKSTDMHSGSFAIKLETFFIGFPVNQTAPGIAATGTINQNTQAVDGGIAYNLRPDSLTGWYKYAPSGNDTGSVEITLSKWNTSTNQRDKIGLAKFIQTANIGTYTYFKEAIAYTSSDNPDTAVVIILCSSSSDPQTGSVMFVDDLGLVIPPVLTATATVTDAICNGSCDGSAIASANNGTSPFTYSWSNGQTGSIATGLCAGTYSVTVTDVSGTTATATVIVNEPIALAVSVSSTDETSSGANDGTATATGSGATSPYSYSWSNGATTSTISGLAPNTYNVTVTDTNGCTSTGSAVVNAAGCALSTTTSTTDVSCNGGSDGSAVATTIGGSSYTYNWSDGQTTQTATGLAAGTYSVTVTEVFDGCTDIVSITVNEPTALSLSISSSDETAPGANDGSATVTASGGTSSYSYSWNNGATTSTISGLAPGTYTVTVTDAASCTDTASVTVGTVGCTFTVAATSTDATCNGGIDGSVDITPAGTSPYTYSWSNGATIGDLAGVGAGTYNVTVADAAGCTGTASAIVSEPTAVTVTTSSTDETTSGANDGTATATGSGGTSPYTYTWSNSATTQTISGLSPGIYMVTVTDANGCTGNGVAVVNLAGCTLTVTASSTDETVAGANDGTATATAANGTTPYSYDWIGVDTTQTITGLAPGVYNVVVTDAAGCLSTASVTINAGAVGIEESTDNTAFSIYPNPASSELFIASSIHTAKLLIFDMTGKNLNEIAINEGINKLNVSAYSKGMYVYALVDADKNILQMGKFIISR